MYNMKGSNNAQMHVCTFAQWVVWTVPVFVVIAADYSNTMQAQEHWIFSVSIAEPAHRGCQTKPATAAFRTTDCTGCCVSLYVVYRACATQLQQQRASPPLLLCAICFNPF